MALEKKLGIESCSSIVEREDGSKDEGASQKGQRPQLGERIYRKLSYSWEG
jgi:hypothetical protein